MIIHQIINPKNYKYFKFIFILAILVWFSLWAFNITNNLTSASSGPDEQLRILVPTYIYEHHAIPSGYDSEVIYGTGNWSYAFYPQFLGAIVSALFMTIVSIFNDSHNALIFGARFASVFFGTATVYIFGLIIRKLLYGRKYAEIYSYLAMAFLAFWPQFTFLSSYINNDIVALFGVSLILYGAILGLKDKWNIKNSVILGFGFTVCLLGYTNSYGFVLFGAVFFLLTLIKQNKNSLTKKSLLLLAIICFIPLVTAGPFYVRNALIYQGDFLGLSTFKSRTTEWELMNNRHVQTSYIQGTGGDVLDLVRDDKYWQTQQESFIGKFGYMTISPSFKLLLIYEAIVILGTIGFLWMTLGIIKRYRLTRKKDELLLGLGVVMASIVTLGLSVYYSLTIDSQPQGRYIIYVLIPLLAGSVLGIKYLIDKFVAIKYRYVVIGIILALYVVNSIIIFEKYIRL
jgi:4-amino-4-deoxy-L-arabinose transferase-like glycosyltransferase